MDAAPAEFTNRASSISTRRATAVREGSSIVAEASKDRLTRIGRDAASNSWVIASLVAVIHCLVIDTSHSVLVGEALFVFCAVISSARVSVAVVGSRSTISAFAGDHVRVGGINEASDEWCRWASGEAIIHSVAVGTGLRTVNGVHANLSDGAVNTIAKLSKAVVGIRSAIGAAANDHVGIGSCNAAGVLTGA